MDHYTDIFDVFQHIVHKGYLLWVCVNGDQLTRTLGSINNPSIRSEIWSWFTECHTKLEHPKVQSKIHTDSQLRIKIKEVQQTRGSDTETAVIKAIKVTEIHVGVPVNRQTDLSQPIN